MAFTLGFHILLDPLGVACPLLTLIANFIGLRRDDPVALLLASLALPAALADGDDIRMRELAAIEN